MFKKRANNELATVSNVVSTHSGTRQEVFAHFGLLFIALILSGLTITGAVVIFLARHQAQAQVDESVPVVMNLAARAVHDAHCESPDSLRQLANDLMRLPQVKSCRIVLDAHEGAEAWQFEAVSNKQDKSALRRLKTKIHGSDGEVRGQLEVGYGTPPNLVATGLFWSVSGLVAVVCLAGFWLIYRWMQCRFRPIGFVRDNLMAYHSGAEQTLELLMLQDESGREVEAWNSLLGAVREMQRELDMFRCRKAVDSSLESLQSQSSHSILDALPVGVLQIDADDRVVYANRSAAWLLQLGDQVARHARLEECLHDHSVVTAIQRLRHNADGTGVDCRLEYSSGTISVHLTQMAPGKDVEDLVVAIQDITQLKEAESSRDEFLAHITHELRTPLTNIRAYAETLNDDFFDDEQTRRECYNVIMTETRRLSKLIENVLSVSQIEAGAAQLTRVTMRVDDTLRQAAQDVQAAADAKSIEMALRIPSKVPHVSGDRHRLQQVWTNLIGNAIKYTPEGGAVTIAVEPGERMLRVRVSDTGIGIAPEYRERIFEKFFRVTDDNVTAEEGTGLGLAITQEIVRLHGGSIWVESELGKGSTFVVELPVTDASKGPEGAGVADGTNRNS
ncbi:MAG: ATP-binding protein [Planctomycetota bacterium]